MASTAVGPSDNITANARRRRMQTTAGTEANSGSLYDTGCFETREGGSWGFCGNPSHERALSSLLSGANSNGNRAVTVLVN